mgnify:CR=1 FL=1
MHPIDLVDAETGVHRTIFDKDNLGGFTFDFSPDGKTLFLSVQHPGETTRSLDNLQSNWPEGNGAIPKPAVVTIFGDALDKLME